LDTIKMRMMSGVERLVEGEGVLVKSLEVGKAAPAATAPTTEAIATPKPAAATTDAKPKAKQPTRPMTKAAPTHPKPRSFSTEAVPATTTPPKRSRFGRVLETRASRSLPNSFWASAADIYKSQGVKGYYAGLTASLAAVVPYIALSDFAYEVMENQYFDETASEEGTYEPPPPGRVLVSFSGVRSVASELTRAFAQYMTIVTSVLAETFLYPLQLVRARMMAQGTKLHPYTYTSNIDCAKQVYARDGFRGFYKGIGTSVVRTVPAVGVAVGMFEYLKRRVGMRWNDELGIWENPSR
jgi:hypothetical protein